VPAGAFLERVSAQHTVGCEEMNVNGPLPVSDETQRDFDLDNEHTEKCDVGNQNERTSEKRGNSEKRDTIADEQTKRLKTHENSVRDHIINHIKFTSPVSSFQIPERVRLAIPVSETLSKVKYVDTAKMMKKGGVSQEQYVQNLYEETAENNIHRRL
jgi:hypothetical protein